MGQVVNGIRYVLEIEKRKSEIGDEERLSERKHPNLNIQSYVLNFESELMLPSNTCLLLTKQKRRCGGISKKLWPRYGIEDSRRVVSLLSTACLVVLRKLLVLQPQHHK